MSNKQLRKGDVVDVAKYDYSVKDMVLVKDTVKIAGRKYITLEQNGKFDVERLWEVNGVGHSKYIVLNPTKWKEDKELDALRQKVRMFFYGNGADGMERADLEKIYDIIREY